MFMTSGLDSAQLYAALMKEIRAQKIIWHFCTPKSASTFFMRHLQETTKSDRKVAELKCVPTHGNRPQVVCAYTVYNSIIAQDPKCVMLGRHLHTLANDHLLELISDNHLVLCQTRSILDTVVSMLDHTENRPTGPFTLGTDTFWHELTQEQKIDHLTHVYVPWHIQFMQTWDRAASTKNVKWLRYDQVVANPNRLAKDILGHYSLQAPPLKRLPRGNINFNVGKAGRGLEMLSDSQRGRIEDIVDALCKPWMAHRHSQDVAVAL